MECWVTEMFKKLLTLTFPFWPHVHKICTKLLCNFINAVANRVSSFARCLNYKTARAEWTVFGCLYLFQGFTLFSSHLLWKMAFWGEDGESKLVLVMGMHTSHTIATFFSFSLPWDCMSLFERDVTQISDESSSNTGLIKMDVFFIHGYCDTMLDPDPLLYEGGGGALRSWSGWGIRQEEEEE